MPLVPLVPLSVCQVVLRSKVSASTLLQLLSHEVGQLLGGMAGQNHLPRRLLHLNGYTLEVGLVILDLLLTDACLPRALEPLIRGLLRRLHDSDVNL